MNNMLPRPILLRALLLLTVYSGVIIAMALAWTRHENAIALQNTDLRLFSAARSLKLLLADDFHDRAVDETSISLDEELDNRKKFNAFAASNELIYVYTLVSKDGGLFFSAPTVTDDEARERKSWYFFPYEEAPAEFRQAMAQGRNAAISYSDEWGDFRTCCSFESSPGGRPYLACADMEIRKLEHLTTVPLLTGLGGALRGRWSDLSPLNGERMEALLHTPGTVIGTAREPVAEGDFGRIADTVARAGFTHVLMNGGNGTMAACEKLAASCRPLGIPVMGIPKTMDNDLAQTDHSPGYGSAARYMAVSVAVVCADVRSCPIHLVIVEALGRNAGWVTAASALASDMGFGPDLIYLPERPFSRQRFLSDAQALLTRKGSGVIVVSEGLRDDAGTPVAPLVYRSGRAEYFGNVSGHLEQLVIRELGAKARSEKPGILARASVTLQSPADLSEAMEAGRFACVRALEGETGKMVTLTREPGAYRVVYGTVELEKVGMRERTMPETFINDEGNYVTPAFTDWLRPLAGPLPPRMADMLETGGDEE